VTRKTFRFLLCVVTFLAVVFIASGPARADDPDMMQGSWSVTKAKVGKNKISEDDRKKLEVTIDGRKFTLHMGDTKETAHIVLDTEKHTIDFFEGSDHKKKLWHGRYEFDGKDLKLCWGSAGDKRPEEFGVRKGSEDRYFILTKK